MMAGFRVFVILVLLVLGVESKRSRGKLRDSTSRRHKTIVDVISDACMPKRTDRLVYRFSNGTHIYVGFDVLSECKVYSMTWTFRKGNVEYLMDRGHTRYDQQPSREVRGYPHHYVLGAAGPRQQKLFQEFAEVCQASITSTTCLMEALARTALKMRELKFDSNCDTQRPKPCHNTQF